MPHGKRLRYDGFPQLRFGELSKVARTTRRSLSHVSYVYNGGRGGIRRDPVVEAEISRRLGATFPPPAIGA